MGDCQLGLVLGGKVKWLKPHDCSVLGTTDKREVDGSNPSRPTKELPLNTIVTSKEGAHLEDNCCGTLKHPDHVKDTDAAIQKTFTRKWLVLRMSPSSRCLEPPPGRNI